MSSTRLQVEQLMSEFIGDYLEFDTTTNIGAGVTIISTVLKSYDGGQDDYFINWWVSFQEGVNAAVAPRQVSDYATATGTLTVRGANLGAEAGAVTIRLHRYDPNNKWRALSRAIEQCYPALYKPVEDRTLITGNILPDNSFEWWTSTAALKMYTGSATITLLRTTAVATIRGEMGSVSVKATAGAGSDYFYIRSDNYPKLLDLMGRTVDFYCWVYPEVADDAYIQIYTLKADNTAQTLTSTTTCPATKWTKLELENQALNDDLVRLEIRFGITTNAKYAYFDNAILCGRHETLYFLPYQFQRGAVTSFRSGGTLSQVRIQEDSYSDEPAYDISPRGWGAPVDFRIRDDNTYKYLDLGGYYDNLRTIRLNGHQPLEALTADTDTIYFDTTDPRTNILVAKAIAIMYRLEQSPVSSEDKGRFYTEIQNWESEYSRLKVTHGMTVPSSRIFTGWSLNG